MTGALTLVVFRGVPLVILALAADVAVQLAGWTGFALYVTTLCACGIVALWTQEFGRG